MNIRDIKTKAKSVLINRNNIIFVFVFIGIVSTIIDYISQILGGMLPFVPLFISLIMLPFAHGNIVTSLKAVNECGDEISIENEGLAGFKRFKELFFTYFIQTIFLMVIILLICLGLFLVAKVMIDDSVFDYFGRLFAQASIYTSDINAYIEDPAFIEMIVSFGGLIILGFIIIMIVSVMYSLTFVLTPYVLEKYKIYGAKAMSESARLMKGHKGTLFTLYLSYLGWFLLIIVITAVIQAFLPIPLVSDLLVTVITVYLLSAEMQTSIAVLFEEIDLEDKNLI